MKIEKDYYIRVVYHALDILELFKGANAEIGPYEFLEQLRISRDRLARILKTLESAHYIERNACTGKYRLGIKSFSIGQTFIRNMELSDMARPFLETIVNKCNESANVSIIKDSHLIYVGTVEANHALKIAPRVGLQLPAYCTAAGKIQLAYLPDEELYRHLASLELKRYTPTTITDRGMLMNNLSKASFLGYAVDNEEYDNGVRCVGAPIRDYTDRIIGAVSISGPSTRFFNNRIETELIPLVRRTTEELSAALGYDGKTGTDRGRLLNACLGTHLQSEHKGAVIDRSLTTAGTTARKVRSLHSHRSSCSDRRNGRVEEGDSHLKIRLQK